MANDPQVRFMMADSLSLGQLGSIARQILQRTPHVAMALLLPMMALISWQAFLTQTGAHPYWQTVSGILLLGVLYSFGGIYAETGRLGATLHAFGRHPLQIIRYSLFASATGLLLYHLTIGGIWAVVKLTGTLTELEPASTVAVEAAPTGSELSFTAAALGLFIHHSMISFLNLLSGTSLILPMSRRGFRFGEAHKMSLMVSGHNRLARGFLMLVTILFFFIGSHVVAAFPVAAYGCLLIGLILYIVSQELLIAKAYRLHDETASDFQPQKT